MLAELTGVGGCKSLFVAPKGLMGEPDWRAVGCEFADAAARENSLLEPAEGFVTPLTWPLHRLHCLPRG